ncbi:MAG TPA: bifunctional ADP-dependent NAD(P)H-hydrate dehydratase/NAD(P)H-hydrate epimerase, partial [Lachnospiraceae bacterium]|nr:bifunctional ADP-dependent NAD(P)H-hydrate dehydratase/NAD(P)H-hydrate epimerase [Lachnospiraceae bacterium]
MEITMYYAVNSSQMKSIDHYTTEVMKIPSLVLMERAAYEVAAVMKQKIAKTDRILAVCGNGNNGGDGIAAGRILYLQGYQVAILFIGEEEAATRQTKLQLEIAKNVGIPIAYNNYKPGEYNILIDAIFGVGLSRPVAGEQ